MGPFPKELIAVAAEQSPTSRRRRFSGRSVSRKITLSEAEDVQLAGKVAAAGTNLSELLVRSALADGAALTREEHVELLATLNAARRDLAELALTWRGAARAGALDEGMLRGLLDEWRAVDTVIYNAVEGMPVR